MTPDLSEYRNWRSYAACAVAPNPDAFHPTDGGSSVYKALTDEYCARCPVTAQCLALARETGASGLYAGTHAGQRRAMNPGRALPTESARLRDDRDRQILEWHALDYSARAIADRLKINDRTVQRVIRKAEAA